MSEREVASGARTGRPEADQAAQSEPDVASGGARAGRRSTDRSQRQYRALLANVHDVIAVVDAEAQVTYVSPAIERMIGFTPEQLLGSNLDDYLDDRSADAIVQVKRLIMRGGEPDDPVLTELRHRDGSVRSIEVSMANRLTDPDIAGVILTLRDVTDKVTREREVRRTRRQFEAIVTNSSDIVIVAGEDGTLTYTSPEFLRVFGRRDWTLQDLTEMVPADGRRVPDEVNVALETPGAILRYEQTLRVDGEARHYSIVATNLLHDPDVGGLVFNARDVTEQRLAERVLADEALLLEAMARGRPLEVTLEALSLMVEQHVDGAVCSVGALDDEGAIRHFTAPTMPASIVAGLDQMTADSSIGRRLRDTGELILRTHADHEDDEVHRVIAANGLTTLWSVPVRAATTGETLGAMAVVLGASRGPDEHELRVIQRAEAVAAIAIERGRFEARLEHQALHDALTDLPNRALLVDRVDHALDLAAARGWSVAVLFIDLDNFKVVNDSLGHAAGDTLLRQVAERLHQIVDGPERTLGRFGGDEFLVVCDQIEGIEMARGIADDVAKALDQPFEVARQQMRVRASVGIALSTSGTRGEALIREADAAMYQAKENGRDQAVVFQPDFHYAAVERLDREQALRSAIEQGQLAVAYQPIARLSDREIVGVEALARWERPGVGLVPADEFIPLVEDIGLIDAIDEWMLDAACAQLVAWDQQGCRPVVAAVNASARRLVRPGFLEMVAATVERHGVSPSRVTIEVTERAFVGDLEATLDVLNGLRHLGVGVAIDDFGTGYASMTYLLHFAVADTLKVDQAFVAALAGPGPEGQAIVSASVALGHTLDMQVVAEGVERESDLALLADLGCDLVQGHLLGWPVTADELVGRLLA